MLSERTAIERWYGKYEIPRGRWPIPNAIFASVQTPEVSVKSLVDTIEH